LQDGNGGPIGASIEVNPDARKTTPVAKTLQSALHNPHPSPADRSRYGAVNRGRLGIGCSSRPYVDGTWSFTTFADFVLNHVAFVQIFDRSALHLGMMEKQITSLGFDKTKPTVGNNFLDRSLRHLLHSSNKNK